MFASTGNTLVSLHNLCFEGVDRDCAGIMQEHRALSANTPPQFTTYCQAWTIHLQIIPFLLSIPSFCENGTAFSVLIFGELFF